MFETQFYVLPMKMWNVPSHDKTIKMTVRQDQPGHSWRFDWSLPHRANNRFRGREVKVSSIGILTARSVVKNVDYIQTWLWIADN